MYCSKCGSLLSDTFNYCSKCGNPVESILTMTSFELPQQNIGSEVYIAGSFNNWLNADNGIIHPSPADEYHYRLINNGDSWKISIPLKNGIYDYKFVINKCQWLGWNDLPSFPRGNDAPGGPNLRIVVSSSRTEVAPTKE